jgi:hypothetical protein
VQQRSSTAAAFQARPRDVLLAQSLHQQPPS